MSSVLQFCILFPCERSQGSLHLGVLHDGQIAPDGSVLDVDHNRQKLSIIEQEFMNAELDEYRRLREEQETKVQLPWRGESSIGSLYRCAVQNMQMALGVVFPCLFSPLMCDTMQNALRLSSCM